MKLIGSQILIWRIILRMNLLKEKLIIIETTSSNLDELKNIKNKLFNKNLIS